MVNRSVILFKNAGVRVVTHLRPWLLRYLLSFVPAVLFAAVATLPLWQSLSYPVIRSLSEQRDLDILLDTLLHMQDNSVNLLIPLLVVFAAFLAWIPVQLTALWLEGGTLFSYMSEGSISGKVFRHTCNRWFGFMVLSQALSILVYSVIVMTTIAVSVIVRILWTPLAWGVLSCGFILMVLFSLWFETTRALALTRNDKHIGHALHHSTNLILHKPIALLIFGLSTFTSMAAVLLVQPIVNAIIPGTWWGIGFIASQILQLIRHGIRLWRRSGEVIYVQTYTTDVSSSSSGIS